MTAAQKLLPVTVRSFAVAQLRPVQSRVPGAFSSPAVLHGLPIRPDQERQRTSGAPADPSLSFVSRVGFCLQASRRALRIPASRSFAVHGLCAPPVVEDHSNTTGCAHADNFCPETDNADCG